MTSVRRVISGFLAVAGAISMGVVAGPAAAAKPAASGASSADTEPQGIFVVGWTGQDFQARLENSVAADPSQAPGAQRVVERLAEKAEAGEDVNLVGSPGGATSDMVQLRAAAPGVRSVDRGLASDQAGAEAVSGPTSFDLRGYAVNNNRSWEVRTELEGASCADGCETTDIVRQTWRITPQRRVDVFTDNSVYALGQGNSTNIFADGFVICDGTECGNSPIGDGGDRDGTGSGTGSIRHPNQAGKRAVDQIRLRATFTPNATRYYDGVRTKNALCRSGSRENCVS